MKRVILVLMVAALLSGGSVIAFAEQPVLTDEQMQQIRQDMQRYADETYKRENGKRSKKEIKEDYFQGSMLRAGNTQASEAFAKGNFDDCKTFTGLNITDMEKPKAKLKTMPFSLDQLEATYEIAADCRMLETMKKVAAAKDASLKDTFQKEQVEVKKAKDYYAKVTGDNNNPLRAAIANYNLAFITMALVDQKSAQEFYDKAFHNDKLYTFVKGESEKGYRVLFIWHNDTVYKMKK